MFKFKEIFYELNEILEKFHKKFYEMLLSATIKQKITELVHKKIEYKKQENNTLEYYKK